MAIAVIISTWDKHPLDYLERLLETMEKYPAGIAYDLCLCVNGMNFKLPKQLSVKFNHILIRENIGFNIGAWDYAWRKLPKYDYYLFLQDECYMRKKNWLKKYIEYYKSSDSIGLLGENYHKSWAKPWRYLMNDSTGNVSNKKKKNATYYHEVLCSWGIEPGENAAHVTTVVQFVKRSLLVKVNGYQVTNDYQTAIAAEISFSKKIESAGYLVEQLPRRRHQLIAHTQWPSDDLLSRLKRSFRKKFITNN